MFTALRNGCYASRKQVRVTNTPFFLIFAPKHRLCVLVRRTHNQSFEQNYEKYKKKKSSENQHFYSREVLLYIAWACFRNGQLLLLCDQKLKNVKFNKMLEGSTKDLSIFKIHL